MEGIRVHTLYMAHTVLQQSSGHRGICIDHNGMPLWSANVIDTYASMARALLKHCMRHTHAVAEPVC